MLRFATQTQNEWRLTASFEQQDATNRMAKISSIRVKQQRT